MDGGPVSVDYVLVALPVLRRDRAVAWFETVLGRPPDMLPHDAEAVWRLTDSASVYVVEDAERAGRGVLTLIVADLDEAVAAVGSRRGPVSALEEVPDAGRKAIFYDPDGNRVELVELLHRT
jgi:predicted enzyme related to lactoylglutathione lyase